MPLIYIFFDEIHSFCKWWPVTRRTNSAGWRQHARLLSRIKYDFTLSYRLLFQECKLHIDVTLRSQLSGERREDDHMSEYDIKTPLQKLTDLFSFDPVIVAKPRDAQSMQTFFGPLRNESRKFFGKSCTSLRRLVKSHLDTFKIAHVRFGELATNVSSFYLERPRKFNLLRIIV